MRETHAWFAAALVGTVMFIAWTGAILMGKSSRNLSSVHKDMPMFLSVPPYALRAAIYLRILLHHHHKHHHHSWSESCHSSKKACLSSGYSRLIQRQGRDTTTGKLVNNDRRHSGFFWLYLAENRGSTQSLQNAKMPKLWKPLTGVTYNTLALTEGFSRPTVFLLLSQSLKDWNAYTIYKHVMFKYISSVNKIIFSSLAKRVVFGYYLWIV